MVKLRPVNSVRHITADLPSLLYLSPDEKELFVTFTGVLRAARIYSLPSFDFVSEFPATVDMTAMLGVANSDFSQFNVVFVNSTSTLFQIKSYSRDGSEIAESAMTAMSQRIYGGYISPDDRYMAVTYHGAENIFTVAVYTFPLLELVTSHTFTEVPPLESFEFGTAPAVWLKDSNDLYLGVIHNSETRGFLDIFRLKNDTLTIKASKDFPQRTNAITNYIECDRSLLLVGFRNQNRIDDPNPSMPEFIKLEFHHEQLKQTLAVFNYDNIPYQIRFLRPNIFPVLTSTAISGTLSLFKNADLEQSIDNLFGAISYGGAKPKGNHIVLFSYRISGEFYLALTLFKLEC